MRRSMLLLALFVGSGLAPAARADETGSAMADAARRFVTALEPNQVGRATFPFESPERLNWHWIPRPRNGLPIKDLKPDQRALAFALLDTGLSTKGAIRAATIMSYEEMLRVEEHGTGPVRDPELYFLSVFGTPGDDSGWGWRIEGHHLALNFTLKGSKVVCGTPFMFGSNPAEVKSGPRKGLKNLDEIDAPANKLAASLSEDQRKAAVANPVAPEVTVTPNPAQAPVSAPEGIAAEKLEPTQRDLLTQVLEAYAANFPEPVRAQLLEQFAREPQSIHFAWYGPVDPTKNHAFHIQGPAFYIDFNNTQNGVNHIHTFYRSLLGDFGLPTVASLRGDFQTPREASPKR